MRAQRLRAQRPLQHRERCGLLKVTQFFQSFIRSSTFARFQKDCFQRNILHEQIKNDVFCLLFAKFVCVLHNVVAAGRGQIARIKFAQ